MQKQTPTTIVDKSKIIVSSISNRAHTVKVVQPKAVKDEHSTLYALKDSKQVPNLLNICSKTEIIAG